MRWILTLNIYVEHRFNFFRFLSHFVSMVEKNMALYPKTPDWPIKKYIQSLQSSILHYLNPLKNCQSSHKYEPHTFFGNIVWKYFNQTPPSNLNDIVEDGIPIFTAVRRMSNRIVEVLDSQPAEKFWSNCLDRLLVVSALLLVSCLQRKDCKI